MDRRSAGVFALSSARVTDSEVMDYLHGGARGAATVGKKVRVGNGRRDRRQSVTYVAAAPESIQPAAAGRADQNGRAMTATTITMSSTVGTSFIARYCRPVRVLLSATNSFRRLPHQWWNHVIATIPAPLA